jgi:hypothetical protein
MTQDHECVRVEREPVAAKIGCPHTNFVEFAVTLRGPGRIGKWDHG